MNRSWAPPPIGFLPFMAMAGTWLALAYLAGRTVATWPLILVVAFTLIFALPVALAGAYTSAVSQAMHLAHFSSGGWVYRLCSGRLLRSLFWIAYALASAFFMLLQFVVYSGLEWVALLLAIPVYWVVHLRSHRIASTELKTRYVFSYKLITAVRWLHPGIMVVLFGVMAWLFAHNGSYTSLTEALAAKRSGIPEYAGSVVVGVGLRLMTLVEGGKAYLWQSNEVLSVLVATASAFAVFFNACATFSCFVIPLTEFKRVVAPVSDAEIPLSLSAIRVAVGSALVTIFVLFIFVPLFAAMEDGLRRNPDVVAKIEKIEKVSVEMIDGKSCPLGTIESIEAAKREAMRTVALSRTVLEDQIDRAFDKMENNVDGYLDWYYSLRAEYTRLGKLLLGDIEKYMEKTLFEKLKQGDSFGEVSEGYNKALAEHKNITSEYQKKIKDMLEKRCLVRPDSEVTAVRTIALGTELELPAHVDMLTFNKRMAGGALAASVGCYRLCKSDTTWRRPPMEAVNNEGPVKAPRFLM